MTQPPEPDPILDALCARTEADHVLERLVAEHAASIAALGEVLDVEAGLADIINHSTGSKEK